MRIRREWCAKGRWTGERQARSITSVCWLCSIIISFTSVHICKSCSQVFYVFYARKCSTMHSGRQSAVWYTRIPYIVCKYNFKMLKLPVCCLMGLHLLFDTLLQRYSCTRISICTGFVMRTNLPSIFTLQRISLPTRHLITKHRSKQNVVQTTTEKT